jgi:hypothetical protein
VFSFRKKFLPLFRDEEILPLAEIFNLGKSMLKLERSKTRFEKTNFPYA